jgi:hypothetical protein
MTYGFPNLFFPGGPHGAAGNNPRYGGTQVDFVTDLLCYARALGEGQQLGLRASTVGAV